MSQARRRLSAKDTGNTGSVSNKTTDSVSNKTKTPTDDEVAKMSVSDLMNAITDRNKDPVVAKLIEGLRAKLKLELVEAVEAEKRSRSLILSGLPESAVDKPPSTKQLELESKVSEILDHIGVECRPIEVYRMGKPNDTQSRLVKIVLPSKSHWSTALSNAYRLRSSCFKNIFVRKSLTQEERKKEYDLRQECRKRNKDLKKRVWVVYRGEIKRIEDLPKSRFSGNV